MKVLKRIDPMSLGKIYVVIYGALGILIGISAALLRGRPILVLIVPVIAIVMGFIVGNVVAMAYNFIASKIGGVKLDIK